MPRNPPSQDLTADDLAHALDAAGLTLRGGFCPADGDGVPPLPDGTPVRTVVVVGNAGPAMWRVFSAQRPAAAEPLDAWTRATLTPIARQFGAEVVFPFGGPPLPFQRWLARADRSQFSPLGILIHPEYGLWHAIRGALLFPRDLGLVAAPAGPSPCQSCDARPCLATCPVSAFSTAGYDAARCVEHLTSGQGEDCVALGCRARRACPLGRTYQYAPEQARHHMESFVRLVSAHLAATAEHKAGEPH
jgi:hypothetical protein